MENVSVDQDIKEPSVTTVQTIILNQRKMIHILYVKVWLKCKFV